MWRLTRRIFQVGAAAAAPLLAPTVVRKPKRKRKAVRVCVLYSSYVDTGSPLEELDDEICTPGNYVKDKSRFVFTEFSVSKKSAYSEIRELVSSNRFDAFYNLCDGAKDEVRAGVEVVQALEAFNAPFTGADSRSFEISKIDMKIWLSATGSKTPNFILVNRSDHVVEQCRHLRFPVIVKHPSGYASVGITRKSKCANLSELHEQCKVTLKEFKSALVEEFVTGREGTVLVCADPESPAGVKVFPPLMMELGSPEDFAHFDNKWVSNPLYTPDAKQNTLEPNDPAYADIQKMARDSFKYILHGVGYGRVDFRIDEVSGVPQFLEVNPNCGMLYAPETGGCYADIMVERDPEWNHDKFITAQIDLAIKQQRARRPWYFIGYTNSEQWSTKCIRSVPNKTNLFPCSVKSIPIVTHIVHDDTGRDAVCCVVARPTDNAIVPLKHSCDPNMAIEDGNTAVLTTLRRVKRGEELTVDYATLFDMSMPAFRCNCGTANCRGVITPQAPSPRPSPKQQPNENSEPTNSNTKNSQ